MLIHHLTFQTDMGINETQAKIPGHKRSPSHKRSESRARVGMCDSAQVNQNRRAFLALICSPMNVRMSSYLSPCSAPCWSFAFCSPPQRPCHSVFEGNCRRSKSNQSYNKMHASPHTSLHYTVLIYRTAK
jgi:hypothetical protein